MLTNVGDVFMKIKPLYDYIVVEVKDQQETTKSGFFLPTSAEKYVTAKALEVGCGADGKMLVKAGDVVLFPANAVIKAKVNGEDVSLISQTDVLGIVE